MKLSIRRRVEAYREYPPAGGLSIRHASRGWADFDNPWWLRGGPSSQSSPVGRRGKTAPPLPSFSFPQRGKGLRCSPCRGSGLGCSPPPWFWARSCRASMGVGGCRGPLTSILILGGLCVTGVTDREGGRTSITRGGCEGAPHLNLHPWGEEVKTSRPLFQFPPEGESFEVLPLGGSGLGCSPPPSFRARSCRASMGVGGCRGAPHLNLLPWGEEVRLPRPYTFRGCAAGGEDAGGRAIRESPLRERAPTRGAPTETPSKASRVGGSSPILCHRPQPGDLGAAGLRRPGLRGLRHWFLVPSKLSTISGGH